MIGVTNQQPKKEKKKDVKCFNSDLIGGILTIVVFFLTHQDPRALQAIEID